jgi:choloylglycine hydrolase
MDLVKFNLNSGAPVMVLNPDNIDLSGNVTGKFQKAAKAPF